MATQLPSRRHSDHEQQHMQRMSEALKVAVLQSVNARAWLIPSLGWFTDKICVPMAVVTGGLCCLQVAFMEQAVPMLDALGFVERYAWYFLSPDQAYDGHNGLPLDTASLYLMNGSATPTGHAYSSF